MKRTSFLQSAVASAAYGIASPRIALAATQDTVRPLVPVAISPDLVTRTTVGLRPFRRGGFVLRAEGHGDRTVVHNFGHGGGGMSLSWGCALLARDLALQTQHRDAAVIGCGVIGLSTARVLQDAGFTVKIYARDLPPETTSNYSGAQWSPKSVFSHTAVDDAFRAQFVRASTLAYARFQTLLGDDYGVRWIENYDCHDEEGSSFLTGTGSNLLGALYPEVATFGPGRHPFPTKYATRFLTMLIEPNRYLRALMRDVLIRGGHIETRAFNDMREVLALDEPLIVNCTGLGSKELASDPQLEPIRGQLSVLAPQPQIDYITLHEDRYMFPRSDGIVLGGTFEHGATALEPSVADATSVLNDHAAFFAAMSR